GMSLFVLPRVALRFVFSRVAVRATCTFGAGFLLPTRFLTLDDEAFLKARFDVERERVDTNLTRDAGPVLALVFGFFVFFDLLRVVIVKLSTRDNDASQRAPTPRCSRQQ